MNPAAAFDLREKLRAVLAAHGLADNVQLEFDLMSAFNQYVRPAAAPVDRKQATLDALTAGMGKNAQLEADWTRLFSTTPNWKTKTNSAFMVWLRERAEHGENLGRFAEWWFAEDWRGQKGAPPPTTLVQELWALAFQEGGARPGKDSRAQSLPEGL